MYRESGHCGSPFRGLRLAEVVAGAVPAIQWIDDAGGKLGCGKMEDGVGSLFALADAIQQRQTGQIVDVSDAVSGMDGSPYDARRRLRRI
jgi:hypothetical protein